LWRKTVRRKPPSRPRIRASWDSGISSEIFHFVQSGYTRILTGVEDVFRSQGFALDFHSLNDDITPLEATAAGHIIAGGLRNSSIERLQHLGKPLVVVDPMMRRKPQGIDCVRIDYANGTRIAMKHLAELGHRDIGFIGFAGSEKYDAYWHALEEIGLPYQPRFVHFLEMPDRAPSMAVGFQCMNALLAQKDRPSAMLVVNDYIALGALEALSIAGLSVLRDISIVGFDDIGEGSVPLTTVRCDLVETGRMAAKRLIERLGSPETPAEELVLPVTLLVRRSTASALHAAPGVA
jgi:LacI family transcriptional regulator